MLSCASARAQEFQLSEPQWQHYSPFFTDAARAELKFEMPGASIFYTLDGTEPTDKSALYVKPIQVQKSAVLKVIAVHPDFRASNVVSFPLIRIEKQKQAKNVKLLQPSSPKYPGHGAATLTDLQKGSPGLQDLSWLGFEGTDAQILLELPRKTKSKKLTISCLSSTGSWIFPPKGVVLEGSQNGVDFSPLSKWSPQNATEKPADGPLFIELPITPKKLRWIKVTVQNYGQLPAWHPGAGKAAWLFIDEIFID
ncbi:MAG: chitobiase/beta-hexosaminidase C-terminal domain-containing protein [Bacteroidota bacterium]